MYCAGYCQHIGAATCAFRWRDQWTQGHLQSDHHRRNHLVWVCEGFVDQVVWNLWLYGSQLDSHQDQRVSSSRQTSSELAIVVRTTGTDVWGDFASLGTRAFPGSGYPH